MLLPKKTPPPGRQGGASNFRLLDLVTDRLAPAPSWGMASRCDLALRKACDKSRLSRWPGTRTVQAVLKMLLEWCGDNGRVLLADLNFA